MGGITEDLARRIGIEAGLLPFETSGRGFAVLEAGACDPGVKTVGPVRAALPNCRRAAFARLRVLTKEKPSDSVAGALARSGQGDALVPSVEP